jgi:hypothetical protein
MTPTIVTLDNGYFKPPTYQIYVYQYGIPYWYSAKFGYLPPVRANVRFCSTFKSRANAEKAARKPVTFYKEQP